MKTVKSLDDNVGRVLDYLKEKGLLDNTLVVYTPIKVSIWVSTDGSTSVSCMKNHAYSADYAFAERFDRKETSESW